MRGLSYAGVAALATGAYAMLDSIVWRPSEALGPLRLTAVMIAAISAIVIWLIVSHELWQRPIDGKGPAKDAALYNGATALILLTAVVCAYLILFAGLLLAATLVVDADIFRFEVKHPVDFASSPGRAWLGIGRRAPAPDSRASNEVRAAAYGHNQRHRDR